MKKYLRWNIYELLMVVIGLFLYCLSIKLFIVPNDLYNGGIMGLSQIIRTIIVKYMDLKIKFDIATPIYYLINIPLLALAYKKMGRSFFYRTLFCVTTSTIFLAVIPTISDPLTDNLLTNILIGGVLCGVGCGIAFTVGASTGGTDIIGMILTKKYRGFSVGKVCLAFNVVIYALCTLIGGIEVLIYSVLYSIFDTIAADKMHARNIKSKVVIFSKDKPTKIIEYIKDTLERDATYWEAKGGYDNSKTYITYTILSKYEKYILTHYIKTNNLNMFVASENNIDVLGNFEKKL